MSVRRNGSELARLGDVSVDAIVVGAGFAGLYMTHRLRKLGLSVQGIEAGAGVGGVWYWNRYPGARCDIESMQYSYSFSEELQNEWDWSEKYAGQPEILRYAEHVSQRFDLQQYFRFNTRVTAAAFDDDNTAWTVQFDDGTAQTARYLILATGCLSTSRVPDIPGVNSFEGRTFHTGRWPHEEVDFSGRRVAIIGTGSSAIQATPIIAKQAKQLFVFQRTPNFSVPLQNTPLSDADRKRWRDNYPQLRHAMRYARRGAVYEPGGKSALLASDEERQAAYERRWQTGGMSFMAAFEDLIFNKESNDTAANFLRRRISGLIDNQELADVLVPQGYPVGTKRLCCDTGYYATFNQPHVSVVDLQATPIVEVTETGVRTSGGDYAVDDIIFATGYDAMTGSILKIDITGANGERLQEKWHAGPRTYLGLMSAGFPNLFLITGPGSPAVLANMIIAIEQHVDWISDCLAQMLNRGANRIDADREYEDRWVEHVNETALRTLYYQSNSWYLGANIPGKPRVFMPYPGGLGPYREKCDEIVRAGYEGFLFDEPAQPEVPHHVAVTAFPLP